MCTCVILGGQQPLGDLPIPKPGAAIIPKRALPGSLRLQVGGFDLLVMGSVISSAADHSNDVQIILSISCQRKTRLEKCLIVVLSENISFKQVSSAL